MQQIPFLGPSQPPWPKPAPRASRKGPSGAGEEYSLAVVSSGTVKALEPCLAKNPGPASPSGCGGWRGSPEPGEPLSPLTPVEMSFYIIHLTPAQAADFRCSPQALRVEGTSLLSYTHSWGKTGDKRKGRKVPAAAVAMGGAWGVMGGPQEQEVPTSHCLPAAAINRAVITTAAAVWSP